MAWGIFKKILNKPFQGIKKYINYKVKSTTVKADLLNVVSEYMNISKFLFVFKYI